MLRFRSINIMYIYLLQWANFCFILTDDPRFFCAYTHSYTRTNWEKKGESDPTNTVGGDDGVENLMGGFYGCAIPMKQLAISIELSVCVCLFYCQAKLFFIAGYKVRIFANLARWISISAGSSASISKI